MEDICATWVQKRWDRIAMRTLSTLLIAACLWSCDDSREHLINGYAPVFLPPSASTVPFPDLTLAVGQDVILPDASVLFMRYEMMHILTYEATSSDTTVVGVEVLESRRFTISAISPGEADVTITVREPVGPPRGYRAPSGRSASRTATVTVTGGEGNRPVVARLSSVWQLARAP